jgi:hypothetical protein
MTNYSCYKCERKFTQKCHLDNHLNRKKTCQKCNKNFETCFVYINKKCIPINDYISKKKDKKDKLKCNKGHDLILVHGPKRRPHFRHKNSGDVGGHPMSEWHTKWQSKFPVTEICYPKKEGQIKDRRADIVIEDHNTIIEIQHSIIDEANVICRNNDYKLHNKELIWIIDGNTEDVKYQELSDGQHLIILNKDWKYKSFSHTYDFILIDILGKIFKIPVKKVTTKMIKLKEYKLIDNVVAKLLTNPKKVWDLWCDDNSCECNLTLWQKGAGNGKTYGLWKAVIENPDKDTFILLSTKHSEKDVILKELKDQQKRKEYHIEENIYEDILLKDRYDSYKSLQSDDFDKITPRQYVLKYTHKINDRQITIIIATVASFYFNITIMNKNCSNPFSTLVPNFLNEGATKVNSNNGLFKFAGKNRYLNKKTQIWFDEAQDNEKIHIQSITKLMLSYKVDVGVIGDRLQSLDFEDNIFTNLFNINIPNINIIRPKMENENMRIKVKGLASEINKIVHFKSYGVPEIYVNEKELEEVSEPFELLRYHEKIRANEKDHDKVKKWCKKIIKKFEKEIKENNYLPEDFIVISPILTARTELIELASKLQNMWIALFDDDNYLNNISDNYWKENNHNKLKKVVEYVQLHKSETTRGPINLAESEKKTRIVSTITSKGDGRNVCFVFNITEKILKLVSGNKIGLRYESHLHVPITRAKRKVYFQLTENGDNIHERFALRKDVYFTPSIKKNFNIIKIIDYISDDKINKILTTNGIEYEKEEQKFDTKPKIDFTDHCSRHAVWKTLLHFNLNRRIKKGHSYMVYNQIIKKIPIGFPETPQRYWGYLNFLSKPELMLENLSNIPIINYNSKYYNGFVQNIRERMTGLKDKLKMENYQDIKSLELTLVDYLLLSYMININRYKKYSPLNINNLYSIINKIENKDMDTKHFYKKIIPIEKTCNKMIDTIETKYGKLDWNIELAVSFKGNNEDFKIRKTESVIIGNNKKYVVDVIMKTTFEEISYLNDMKEILLNRFIIYNPREKKEKSKNIKRFSNKKLITYVLVLETNEYKELNWEWDKGNDIKNIVKEGVESYFSSFHKELFYFGNKICINWTKIKENNESMSPFYYIIDELSKTSFNQIPKYITRFFENLQNQYKINVEEIKNVVYNEDIFMKRIEKYLKKSLDNFFDDEEIEFDF